MQLIEVHPFWGYLLLQMKVEFDSTIPAFGTTDGVQWVWLNPVRTATLSLRELGFVLLHLLAHQLFAVTARRRGRDPMTWARATDYAVNRMVAAIDNPLRWDEAMYEPVPGALLDSAYDALAVEAIYERLASRRLPANKADQGAPEPDPVGTDAAELFGMTVQDHGGAVDVHLPVAEHLDEGLREELLDRFEQAIAQHHAQGDRGDLPGEVDRLVDARHPRVPWRRLLWRHVSSSLSRDEYDPRRPNRRWLAEGLYLPGPGAERVELVIVALDTSGSMSTNALSDACAEIRAIASEVADIRVLIADRQVHEVITMNELDDWLATRRPRGGGGTDHRPVFRWIEEQRLAPELFIGLTDLETTLPPTPPGFPVLWVTPPGHGPVPWGRVVSIP
jgi:predicted metal-dependent peptidase